MQYGLGSITLYFLDLALNVSKLQIIFIIISKFLLFSIYSHIKHIYLIATFF